ncbi:hypothetical protein ANO14919_106410 [Xylariales sp. No.14919]|nr:hypothetical protein ANO14919_106410 [Xylariales sp. No.14919]
MVLGHEGVDIVEAVDDQVKSLKVHVLNWLCLNSDQLYCDLRQLHGFTNLDQGSFASHAVWNEDFIFPIPESLSLAAAAPLMCAGAAVYSALQRARVRSSDRVGILGMGGLGHLAVQFAAKMGCDVVCLLVTAAQQPTWTDVIPWVRKGGTISAMTVDPTELNFKSLPFSDLLMNGIEIQGSLPAPREMHKGMLKFAAFHKIFPMIDIFSFTEEGILVAMMALRDGKIRYRAVLEAS